jgi:hypothetical protein
MEFLSHTRFLFVRRRFDADFDLSVPDDHDISARIKTKLPLKKNRRGMGPL